MDIKSHEYYKHTAQYYSQYTSDLKYYDQFLIDNITADSKVLDVGCNIGNLLKSIHEKNSGNKNELFGIDLNKWLIKDAKKNCPESNLFVSDGLHQPFKESTFDFIFCIDVIEHVQKPQILLHEFSRILKPDGKIIINTPDRYSLILDKTYGKNFIRLMWFNLLRCLNIRKLDPTHIKEFNYYEFKKLLRSQLMIIEKHNGTTKRYIPFMIGQSSMIFQIKLMNYNKNK